MTRLSYLLLATVAVSVLSACTASVGETAEHTCSGTCDFDLEAEPLGSSRLLDARLREVAKGEDGAKLIDITRAAGWNDGWDRLVEVRASTTAADLDKKAKTPGYCWKNLPTTGYREGPEQGYYLFVSGGKPVQVVSWTGNKKPLEVRDRDSLSAESMLVPSQWHDKLGRASTRFSA